MFVCVSVFVCVRLLPSIHHFADVSTQKMWAGQCEEEVQIDGTESSNCPIRAATEDDIISDREGGGLRRLRHRDGEGWARKSGK